MPQINFYVDNKSYIKFLELNDTLRSDIRRKLQKIIKKEVEEYDRTTDRLY